MNSKASPKAKNSFYAVTASFSSVLTLFFSTTVDKTPNTAADNSAVAHTLTIVFFFIISPSLIYSYCLIFILRLLLLTYFITFNNSIL